MEIVKKTDRYVILKKRSGRYGVRSMNRSWINGPEKERILEEAGLKSATKNTKDNSKDDDKQPSNNDDEETQESASV